MNLLLLCAAMLVALGAGEIVIRLAAPQQLIQLRPDLYRPVDTLGWAHRPKVHTRVNTGDRPVAMDTDENGFRTAASGRPPGRVRILLLGDSFVAALQVEYDQSFAGLVERCFVGTTGQAAAVWNTGVSGWDPPQYYLQARQLLDTTRFDLVVVSVFLGNDVVLRRVPYLRPREPDPRRPFRLPRKFTRDEFVEALLAPLNDALETRSHLFIFLKDRFQSLLIRAGLTAVEIPTELRRDQAASPRWELTDSILADIDSLASRRHIPTVFVLVPAVEQVDPAVLEFRTGAFGIDPASLDVDQPEQLIAAGLQRRGLSFVSLLRPLREARTRGLVLYGRVDTHLSPDGHRVFWTAVAPELARRLGLPYSPAAGSPPCSLP